MLERKKRLIVIGCGQQVMKDESLESKSIESVGS